MKYREYIAHCDNGHDYFEVFYTSCYRAGSKKNAEDAKRAMRLKGRRGYIISVELKWWD